MLGARQEMRQGMRGPHRRMGRANQRFRTRNASGGFISRVLSPHAVSCFHDRPRGGSHSSRPPIAGRLKQPTRVSRRETRLPCHATGARPLFGLAPGGVCHAGRVAKTPVRSCRTLSPLPVSFRLHRRYTLCGTFPWLRHEALTRRALPATLASWSPDFPRMGCPTRGCLGPLMRWGRVYQKLPVRKLSAAIRRFRRATPSRSALRSQPR